MAAKDIIHDIVREALEKEGWFIIGDPFFLRVSENIGMFVDLAADKLLLAERETRKIAEELESDRILYLAIPNDIYNTFFQDSFIQKVIEAYSIKLMIVNPKKGEITLWQPSPTSN